MYQRQFNYRETKQVILADIFNTLKDKGYNVDEPIRIPEEMSSTAVSINAREKYLDIEYNFSMIIKEIQSSLDSLWIIGNNYESDEDCDYNDEELNIGSLSDVLDFVEDMPDAKDATYDEEE